MQHPSISKFSLNDRALERKPLRSRSFFLSLAVGLFLTGFLSIPGTAAAEQMVITDCSGVPRLSKEIVSGSTSTIKFGLTSLPSDFELKLTRVPTGEVLFGETQGDAVIVENVSAGTWKACGHSNSAGLGAAVGGAGAAGKGGAGGAAGAIQFTEIAVVDIAALSAGGVAAAVVGGAAVIGGGIAIGEAAGDSNDNDGPSSPSRSARNDSDSPSIQPVSDSTGNGSGNRGTTRTRRPGETLADSDCDIDDKPIPLSPVS